MRTPNFNNPSKQTTNARAPSFARSLRKGWKPRSKGIDFPYRNMVFSPEAPEALLINKTFIFMQLKQSQP